MRYEEDFADKIKTSLGLTKSVKSNWKKNGVIPSQYFVKDGVFGWDGKSLREWIDYWGFTDQEMCQRMTLKSFTLQRWLQSTVTPSMTHQKELLEIQQWFFDVLKCFSSKTISQWISEWKTTVEIVSEHCDVREDVVKEWIDGVSYPTNRERNKLILLMLLQNSNGIQINQ